nr:MAG TPA: hypothetical protein [Caudoviricetes sp.]
MEKEPEIPPGRTPKKHRLEIVVGQREGLRTAGISKRRNGNPVPISYKDIQKGK